MTSGQSPVHHAAFRHSGRKRRRPRVCWLPVWSTMVCACGQVFEPPASAVPFDPPPEYRVWWVEIESCAQIKGDFDRVRWFMVPGDGWVMLDGENSYVAQGFWKRDHRIYLASAALMWKPLVQHEMLHDITGISDNDNPFFRSLDPLRPLERKCVESISDVAVVETAAHANS